MTRQIISTPDAPASPMYSQGIRSGSTIWVSGTTGTDATTGQLAGPTIQEQTRQALINCENILRAGGGGHNDIVEVLVLLADPDDFAGLNEEYAAFFPSDPPARAVARLGPVLPGVLVSIRMTAVLDG